MLTIKNKVSTVRALYLTLLDPIGFSGSCRFLYLRYFERNRPEKKPSYPKLTKVSSNSNVEILKSAYFQFVFMDENVNQEVY